MNRKTALLLIAILFLQFLLVAALSHQRPWLDEGRYITTGWMISQGKVPFKDTFSLKPPTLEIVLAGLFFLAGPSLLAARLFMGLIAVMQIVLIFLFARRLFGERAALFAALFYALWSIGFSSYLVSISSFTALTTTAALFFAYSFLFEKQSRRGIFLTGLFLGLACIFKQTMIPFSIGIAASIAILHFQKNRKLVSIQEAASFGLGFLLFPAVLLLYLVANNTLVLFFEGVLFPLNQFASYALINIDARSLMAAAAFSPVVVLLIALAKNAFNSRKIAAELLLILAWFAFSFSNMLPFMGCCLHLLPALPPASILAGFVIAKGFSSRPRQKLFCSRSPAPESNEARK